MLFGLLRAWYISIVTETLKISLLLLHHHYVLVLVSNTTDGATLDTVLLFVVLVWCVAVFSAEHGCPLCTVPCSFLLVVGTADFFS